MKKITLGLCLIILACKPSTSEKPISASGESMTTAENGNNTISERLIHSVYFDLKPDATDEDIAAFEKILSEFSRIESAEKVVVGRMADTGDQRMDEKYDIALHVEFTSLEKLAMYQADSIHLSGKKEAGSFLSGPPVVFDFWSK